MAKFAAQSVLDAPLDLIATATEMYFCNGQPTSRADAVARQSAPAIALTGADFAKSGATPRVLTLAAKVSGAATVAQPTDHIALCTGATLLYATTAAAAQNSNIGAVINSGAVVINMPQVV